MSHRQRAAMAARPGPGANPLTIDLTAVIIAVTDGNPRVLLLRPVGMERELLPAGPLQPDHRTLQAALRNWVEHQTHQVLGHVEQLYTFGDRDRVLPGGDGGDTLQRRALTLAYLALVQEARPAGAYDAQWRNWYEYLPWEDRREGDGSVVDPLVERLLAWVARAPRGEERLRAERVRLSFGLSEADWDEERTLDRYELLYEAELVPEAWFDRDLEPPAGVAALPGRALMADHRRILATAVSRLRGKIKYRPVLFELMPPKFTLLQLQRTAEALSGARLHKQNFRRLIEHQRLVEETGELDTETGGRPAKLMRFRHEVMMERPAAGVRLKALRRTQPH